MFVELKERNAGWRPSNSRNEGVGKKMFVQLQFEPILLLVLIF